jgi:hypothetical protein
MPLVNVKLAEGVYTEGAPTTREDLATRAPRLVSRAGAWRDTGRFRAGRVQAGWRG